MLTFNLNRVRALLVKELYFGYLPALKAVSILVFLVYLINLIGRFADKGPSGDGDPSGTIIKFGILLLICGFLYASLAFREFRKLPNRAEFLSLPGSSLEKISVKWFVTNPLFILTMSLLIVIAAAIFTPFIHKFGGQAYQNEIFFSKEYWNLVGIYFIIHSIFFFGSIAFNRVAIVQTLVVLIIIALALALINGLFFRIVWADMFDGFWSITSRNGNMEFANGERDPGDMWQIKFFVFAFKYLIAPVMWVASIFKLSEKHV